MEEQCKVKNCGEFIITNCKEYRFLTNWHTKRSKVIVSYLKKVALLVITKSMKDTMCLKGLGVTACCVSNSETQWLSENMLNDLKKDLLI